MSSPPTLPSLLLYEIERRCAAYQQAWKKGQPPELAAALDGLDETARPELFRRLLDLEQEERSRRGQPLSDDEIRQRFHHLGAWVEEVLRDLNPDLNEVTLTLQVVAGPRVGQSFTFSEHGRFTVGRRAGLDFSVPEDDILSRLHCVIEFNPPLCRVEDNNSRNKTWITRTGLRFPVEHPTDLLDGDEVTAGRNLFRVSLGAGADTQTRDFSGDPGTPGSKLYDSFRLSAPPGYIVEGELGRGGMGVVYRARDAAGGLVALKSILPAVLPTPGVLARFQREVGILRSLSHPHIVAFHDSGLAGSHLWFAMEYVEGPSAAALLRQHGKLPVERVVPLGLQLLDALAHAHARGFVHRDVKPGNLLIGQDGSREVLKLADFGLARAYQASALSGLTRTGVSGGTPAFMPPEQVRDFRSAQPAADQYAAAATLYNLLTGEPIYEPARSWMELLLRILDSDPIPLRAPPAELPSQLVQVLNRALAREPEGRYPDIQAMREALAGVEAG
jgi:serine/threonine-protein kinase